MKYRIREGTISTRGNYKGGRYRDSAGYFRILMHDHPNVDSKGYILEHRYLMEQHIGRLLESHEHIDHINGVKDDNRIENLRILTASEHSRIGYNPGRFPKGYNAGVPCPEWQKEAISRANTGKKRTPEQLARIIAGQQEALRNKPMKDYICPICNTGFQSKQNRVKFCSRSCRRKDGWRRIGK